jgi:hypothetical protein
MWLSVVNYQYYLIFSPKEFLFIINQIQYDNIERAYFI